MLVTPEKPPIVLTHRQKEVLRLVADGYSNGAIAKKLIITRHTVKAHICSIYEQFNTNSRVTLIVDALKRGMLDLYDIKS